MEISVYTQSEAEKLVKFLSKRLKIEMYSIEDLTGFDHDDFTPGVCLLLDLDTATSLSEDAIADWIAPFFPLAQMNFNTPPIRSVCGYDYSRLTRDQWYELIGEKLTEVMHIVNVYYLCLNADRDKMVEQIDLWNQETVEGKVMYFRLHLETLKKPEFYRGVGIKNAFDDIKFSDAWRSLEVGEKMSAYDELKNSWRKISHGADREAIALEVDAMIKIMADKIRLVAEYAVFGDLYLDY